MGHWEGGREERKDNLEPLLSPPGWQSHGAVQRTGHTVRRKSWSLTVREPVSRGNAVHKRELIMQNVRLTSVLFWFFFSPHLETLEIKSDVHWLERVYHCRVLYS